MNTTLGKRISALRHERAFKQDELAEKLGVSAQAVSKWENDQTCPDISLLPQLSKLLGVSIDELLTGKKEELTPLRLLPEEERKSISDMMLRIVVNEKDGDVVRINIPISIIEIAINSGLNMSQVSGNKALYNIDLNRVMEIVREGFTGNILEVESPDKDVVRIYVE